MSLEVLVASWCKFLLSCWSHALKAPESALDQHQIPIDESQNCDAIHVG